MNVNQIKLGKAKIHPKSLRNLSIYASKMANGETLYLPLKWSQLDGWEKNVMVKSVLFAFQMKLVACNISPLDPTKLAIAMLETGYLRAYWDFKAMILVSEILAVTNEWVPIIISTPRRVLS